MDFIKIPIGTGHDGKLVTDTLCRCIEVIVIEHVRKRVKFQRIAIEIHTPHVFAQ